MKTTTQQRATEIVNEYCKLVRVSVELSKHDVADMAFEYWNAEMARCAVMFAESVGRLVKAERAVR